VGRVPAGNPVARRSPLTVDSDPFRADGVRVTSRPILVLIPLLAAACPRPAEDSTPVEAPARAASATTSPITEGDLRTRVAIFADDSMLGRDAPGPGDIKAANYLASELARLGLARAGGDGTYFQDFRLGTAGGGAGTARNVVAVLPGSDPALRGQYLALGSHKDHVGVARRAVDHDSLRITAWFASRAEVTGEIGSSAGVRAAIDSVRRLRPPRRDSIANGADDDASGSMALLEIAEALAAAPHRPRRSILFVWHSAEEDGLVGSAWFTDHPTVPRDSIVAQINIDMIGRGSADDVAGGGDDYLIAVGHRRLSSELGAIVDSVNAARRRPFRIDLSWDDPRHPQQIYGRSDHANYARYGIPIVFFFTGLHHDYHSVTDEAPYLDYPHYTRIVEYIQEVAIAIANRETRVRVDRR
jgi:hypothetical protein